MVYTHINNGRLAYLSGRSIKVKRHYNPPRDIIGQRQPYFNHCYRSDCDEVVVVEGQADAITFGVWDVAAIALGGMSLSDALLARLRNGIERRKAGIIRAGGQIVTKCGCGD